MWNRAGCGTPEGYVWKRIDYSWSRGMSPLSMSRFGMVQGGREAPSDHAGIVVEYPLPRTMAASIAPVVSIRSPATGATLTGTPTISVEALDEINVVKMLVLWIGGFVTYELSERGVHAVGKCPPSPFPLLTDYLIVFVSAKDDGICPIWLSIH